MASIDFFTFTDWWCGGSWYAVVGIKRVRVILTGGGWSLWRGWSYLLPPHLLPPQPQPGTDIRVICCTVQSTSPLYQISDARYQISDIISLQNILLPREIYRDGEILVREHSALGEYFIVYFS